MKKLAFLTLFALLISFNASSQLRFGLRAGLNTAYFDATEVVTEDFRVTTLNDATIGFHFGIMSQISFFGVFLQPELLLTSVGSDVRVRDMREAETVTLIRDQNFTKLDFPVLAGFRFGPLRLGAGPVGTIMLHSDSGLRDLEIREDFNAATFGFQAGAGLDVGPLAIDLKYEGNLTRLGSGIVVAGVERDFDSRVRQIILSIGLFF